MIHLCIRYVIDPRKLQDFEQYARRLPPLIHRCGGDLTGYYLPTRFAGPTNVALALIAFPSLAAYEKYRQALGNDADATDALARAEASGCILVEDRSILQRVPE
jgi:hypothetical protein